MKRNILIIVAVIIAAVILRFTWGSITQFIAAKKMGMRQAPSVQVEEVGESEIIREFDAPGRVNSKYQVNVLARIAGYLQKSYFNEGDYVKEGQVLFQIEPTEYINAAHVNAANVENTRAQLEYAENRLPDARQPAEAGAGYSGEVGDRASV